MEIVVKKCPRCQLVLDASVFGKSKAKADGLQSHCKPCRKETNRAYYLRTPERNPQRQARNVRARAEANAYVLEYLAAHPCVDCGESDIVVLEFDHVRDEKEHTISSLISRGSGLATIAAEIAKCEVRCANCHRRVTARRAGWQRATYFAPTGE